MPQKQHKKRRLGISAHGIERKQACGVNDVWCWDFVHDRDERGRPLKWLIIEDEFTREGLALEVERSMTSGGVLDVLRELFIARGVPRHVRSDNGPEFIARAICQFLEAAGSIQVSEVSRKYPGSIQGSDPVAARSPFDHHADDGSLLPHLPR
ncbi:MAG: transposase family protein [Phycisphaeraceae bacterium]|nr:transposase family protein [Phycisphaeraceae bacterium]